jgi:hypothetical protein
VLHGMDGDMACGKANRFAVLYNTELWTVRAQCNAQACVTASRLRSSPRRNPGETRKNGKRSASSHLPTSMNLLYFGAYVPVSRLAAEGKRSDQVDAHLKREGTRSHSGLRA